MAVLQLYKLTFYFLFYNIHSSQNLCATDNGVRNSYSHFTIPSYLMIYLCCDKSSSQVYVEVIQFKFQQFSSVFLKLWEYPYQGCYI
jgi:hypothetical protein